MYGLYVRSEMMDIFGKRGWFQYWKMTKNLWSPKLVALRLNRSWWLSPLTHLFPSLDMCLITFYMAILAQEIAVKSKSYTVFFANDTSKGTLAMFFSVPASQKHVYLSLENVIVVLLIAEILHHLRCWKNNLQIIGQTTNLNWLAGFPPSTCQCCHFKKAPRLVGSRHS